MEDATGELTPAIRYIGLDVHKQYSVAAGVDERQQIVLSPRRIPLAELGTGAVKMLRSTDVVVLEAMSNTWQLHDQPHAAGSRGRRGQPGAHRAHERARSEDRPR